MKNNKIKKPTYADRARKILRKYPRANWDAIERNDMLKELRELKIEQEATRPLMEIADKANEMDAGAFSPSQTDQSFGPTNPQQGDPRFQRWAQEVPGMGGYNVDPSKINIQGMQQGVDPRKMSMQQYQADTQFDMGGRFTRRPNISWGKDAMSATPGVSDPRYNIWKDNVPKFAGSYDYNNSLDSPNLFGDLMPQGRGLAGSNNQSARGLTQGGGGTSYAPQGNLAQIGAGTQVAQQQGFNPSGSASLPFGNIEKDSWKGPYDLGLQSYDQAVAANDQYPKWNEFDFSKENPVNTPEEAAQGLANAKQLDGAGATHKVPGTSALPFLISAGSSLIGDIAQMRNLRKMPQNIDLGRMTASKVDFEPERQLMTRQANQMSNVNTANARNLGMNAANAYANTAAANAGLYDQYGSGIGQSYMREQNTNAQLAQQANQTNASLRAQEVMQNTQLKQQQVAGRGQGIASIANTLPAMTADMRQQGNQQQIINMMGDNMGIYQRILKDPTFLQKLAQAYGMDPRDILARLNTGIQGNQPITI